MIKWLGEFSGKIPLRTKILLATILVVGLFTGLGLYQVLTFHTRSMLDHVAESGNSLLDNTYSAIKYPMSVGDSKTVEEQLKDIKGNMKGVEVFISDFHGDISYASEETRIRANLADYLREAETRNALTATLKTGSTPGKGFPEISSNDAFLITMKPLLNEKTCHHCHGATQKVLGAMVVKQSVKEVYDSLSDTRNRLLIFSALEILGIILFINFVLARVVTRRIRALAEKTGLVSAGDITVEVQDNARDSIGALSRNFNQMVHNLRDRIEYANSLKFGITDPFFIVDPQMKVTYINEAAAAYTGLQPNDIEGKRLCEDVFGTTVCETECPVRKAMATGEPTLGNKMVLEGKDGKLFHIVASAAALKDSAGRILGAFELMRDVTKEVEAEALIQEAYHKEEEAKESLQKGIDRLSGVLGQIARGDLTVRAETDGAGDSMVQLITKTNDTLDRMEDLIRKTSRAALTVVRGIRYISDENQGFAQRTQQQAATMEEISATVEQIISNIHQNAGNTQRADSLSKEAVSVAQEGGATVEKTTQAMLDMAMASRKIVEMMDLINEITFQTNLLSINAAVEAARAGEQGRGFAVVANEVRNLAKRSSEASKDIQKLVRDIMDRVTESKDWVGELENRFEKIIKTVTQVSEALTEVSYATQESSQGVNQIGQGIKEMSDVIEHNASLVDELAEAAEHLDEKASLLQRMTEKFVISDHSGISDEGFEVEKSGPRAGKPKQSARSASSTPLREKTQGHHGSGSDPDADFDKDLDEESFEEF
jgi:methyl-accepting chemotaxis protein